MYLQGGYLVCQVVRKRVKQKGIDTVEIDDGKGYREQRLLIGDARGNNKEAQGEGGKARNDSVVELQHKLIR